ncbi:MAG: hypothetical protein N2486_00105 [Caloramator sp.]|nr:hypothetical protein [Caloramator sp.]
MILMQCALYAEAKPLIERFRLKKNMKENHFEVFEGDNVKLIISGYGKINAATAAVYFITKNNLECEAFVNIGIAGSLKRKIKDAVLINKLVDKDTGRSFYPDILIKHSFNEGTLETFSKVVIKDIVEDLCDMEGSALFEALSKFLPPHKVQVVKIVSDNLDGERLDQEFVYDIIRENIDKVEDFIIKLQRANKREEFLDEKDKKILQVISQNLNLTEFQKNELLKQYISFKIRGENVDVLIPFLEVKVKTKNEGKIYYNEIIRTLSK